MINTDLSVDWVMTIAYLVFLGGIVAVVLVGSGKS